MAIVSRERIARFGQWLEAVEQSWLGWSLPPARRAIADAGWRPDAPLDYCGRCGSSVGAGERTSTGCGSCRGLSVQTDRVVRLGPYTGPLREWVRAVKYRRWGEMALFLGRELGTVVASELTGPFPPIVVPTPMPWQRRLYRGIDHAGLIASGVAARLRAPVVEVLAKANGPPQMALPARKRRQGASNLRIRSRRPGWLEGMEVVIVDDVRTTGASLGAAARLVRRLGPARVVGAVVAVAEDPARRARAHDAERPLDRGLTGEAPRTSQFARPSA